MNDITEYGDNSGIGEPLKQRKRATPIRRLIHRFKSRQRLDVKVGQSALPTRDLLDLHCVAAQVWLDTVDICDHVAETMFDPADVDTDVTAFVSANLLVAAQCRTYAEHHYKSAERITARFSTPLLAAINRWHQFSARTVRSAPPIPAQEVCAVNLEEIKDSLEFASTVPHIGPEDATKIVGVWHHCAVLWKAIHTVVNRRRASAQNQDAVTQRAYKLVSAGCKHHTNESIRLAVRELAADNGISRPRTHRAHRSTFGTERLAVDTANRWCNRDRLKLTR